MEEGSETREVEGIGARILFIYLMLLTRLRACVPLMVLRVQRRSFREPPVRRSSGRVGCGMSTVGFDELWLVPVRLRQVLRDMSHKSRRFTLVRVKINAFARSIADRGTVQSGEACGDC